MTIYNFAERIEKEIKIMLDTIKKLKDEKWATV
jgi:hypothetical protein